VELYEGAVLNNFIETTFVSATRTVTLKIPNCGVSPGSAFDLKVVLDNLLVTIADDDLYITDTNM
jgi:hypothetical protein